MSVTYHVEVRLGDHWRPVVHVEDDRQLAIRYANQYLYNNNVDVRVAHYTGGAVVLSDGMVDVHLDEHVIHQRDVRLPDPDPDDIFWWDDYSDSDDVADWAREGF